ncbi:hypothetical protein TCAL_01590 [Tigriopus californicus]|uniref:Apple domain-containing protein n=1 Tax=Tigriopus californicus TaxID=6832 RepID=A0A553P7A7_TIGCA|nr:uncharacterized protein LOC131877871 [Tigriopus californicus]TRY73571.1 hypothetical protein TCAL_01590 [Tigriopus californicus]
MNILIIASSMLLAVAVAIPVDVEETPNGWLQFDADNALSPIPYEPTDTEEDRSEPCMKTVFGKRMSGVDKPNASRRTLGECKSICSQSRSTCKAFEHYRFNPAGSHDDDSQGLCRLFYRNVGTLDSDRGSMYATGIKGQC